MPHEWASWVARLECCHDVGGSRKRGDTRPAPGPGDELRCPICMKMYRVVEVVTADPERVNGKL